MSGFKDFLMRGNLIELAVAFIIGAVFGDVTKSFTRLVMDAIARIFGSTPDFSSVTVGGVNVGVFITSLITFAITSAVIYFGVVLPYNSLKSRLAEPATGEAGAPTSEELLSEIRDILAAQAK